jgi:UDP-N-acetylmuramate dehydrogenase
VPVPLRELTTMRVGGPAARFVAATETAELVELVRSADQDGDPVLVMGGGSNLIVGDQGVDGLVVQAATTNLEIDGAVVRADAGLSWDAVVTAALDAGLAGLEALSGIPGSVGGTPIQNVGAYGALTSDVLTSVGVYDRSSATIEQWDRARCGFGRHRFSAFKRNPRYVVLDVTYTLRRSPLSLPIRYQRLADRLEQPIGAAADAVQVRTAVLSLRAESGMLLDAADHDTWSVGSFFVNPFVEPALVPPDSPHWEVDGQVKLSAAWLIEQAGFTRGYGNDRVRVSTKHTLALTNRGTATTADLLELAAEIRAGVQARFGIRLRPEAHLVGVDF